MRLLIISSRLLLAAAAVSCGRHSSPPAETEATTRAETTAPGAPPVAKTPPPGQYPAPVKTAPAPAAPDPAPAAPDPIRTAPAARDEIDGLVARLDQLPLWDNGAFPEIDLAASAPIEEVLTRVFAATSFDRGPVRRHQIVKTKKVEIGAGPNPYTAALVDTDQGRKIVLLRPTGATGWWSRVFDAEGG